MQRYVVQVVDDLDGVELDPGDAVQVQFGVDDRDYLIDLSAAHAESLRTLLTRYVDAARREEQTTQARRAAAPTAAQRRTDLDAVRVWARGNGYSVAPRGRVPVAVLSAYDASR